jgi:hypothetical protein
MVGIHDDVKNDDMENYGTAAHMKQIIFAPTI